MKESNDVYMEPEVFYYDNAIVRVYHPILTEEERARRMKRIEEWTVEIFSKNNLFTIIGI